MAASLRPSDGVPLLACFLPTICVRQAVCAARSGVKSPVKPWILQWSGLPARFLVQLPDKTENFPENELRRGTFWKEGCVARVQRATHGEVCKGLAGLQDSISTAWSSALLALRSFRERVIAMIRSLLRLRRIKKVEPWGVIVCLFP